MTELQVRTKARTIHEVRHEWYTADAGMAYGGPAAVVSRCSCGWEGVLRVPGDERETLREEWDQHCERASRRAGEQARRERRYQQALADFRAVPGENLARALSTLRVAGVTLRQLGPERAALLDVIEERLRG